MAADQPTPLFYKRAYIWFTLALLVIAAGFFKSFFTKLAETDLSHHFHGIVATLWLLLLIVQPYLYSRGNLQQHRKLGRLSFVLYPLLIAGGLMMVHSMINSKQFYPPLSVYQLSFLDFFYMIQFSFFFIMAIVSRREVQYHARYMAGTVLVLIPPGLARLLGLFPGFETFDAVLNVSYFIMEAVILLLLWDDKRSGKIRSPYVIALACTVIQHIGLNYIHHWEPWQRWMDAFGNL